MTGSSAEPASGEPRAGDVRGPALAYDPDWAALGAQECATVRALLGDLAIDVIHAGSTAVPGMAAKPILDIVAAVGDSVAIDEVVGRLGATGAYGYEGDQGDDGGSCWCGAPGSCAPCTSTSWGWAVRHGWTTAASIRSWSPTMRRGSATSRSSVTGAAVPPRPSGVHQGQGRGDPLAAGRPGAVDGAQTN